MDKKLEVVNRGKVAYLAMNNIFEDAIEKIFRNGREQWAFVYTPTETIRQLLIEFDADEKLHLYNSCFKNIAYSITKAKSLDNAYVREIEEDELK